MAKNSQEAEMLSVLKDQSFPWEVIKKLELIVNDKQHSQDPLYNYFNDDDENRDDIVQSVYFLLQLIFAHSFRIPFCRITWALIDPLYFDLVSIV